MGAAGFGFQAWAGVFCWLAICLGWPLFFGLAFLVGWPFFGGGWPLFFGLAGGFERSPSLARPKEP